MKGVIEVVDCLILSVVVVVMAVMVMEFRLQVVIFPIHK